MKHAGVDSALVGMLFIVHEYVATSVPGMMETVPSSYFVCWFAACTMRVGGVAHWQVPPPPAPAPAHRPADPSLEAATSAETKL